MNRLARETSPYLLQHKGNPVDWYPWGEEALERSRVENKPILLSIGYSACHWCHVMEHESFENPAIAKLMNERYINIKVDREERPDLDHIYQNVAQAITRSGGWPLTVFLTPELQPYFGGTYFPPEDRYGRPGFPRVLEALSQAYRDDPKAIAENAEKLTTFIRGMDRVPSAGALSGPPTLQTLEVAAQQITSGFDPVLGGLAGAPKFPNPMLLSYLARHVHLKGDAAAREVLHKTLERMASGGIFDQIGGGFHRYSVDESWSVPHFEKMLYDNGLLLRVYSETLCLEGEKLEPALRDLYLRALRTTIEYLGREMRSPEGAFYSTQDADSEGEEGKFFVWKPSDLKELVARGVITEEGSHAFAFRYGVSDAGNFEHGTTVLFLDRTVREVGAMLGKTEVEAAALIDETSRKLFAERAKRIAPATDRKILASWNGLAISGLCWAAQALRLNGDFATAAQAIKAAEGAFDCVITRMTRTEGRLFSTLQEGKPKLNAYLDDYAFMAMAALDLSRYSDEGSEKYLGHAREWMDRVLASFSDGAEPGFYFTSNDHEALIHRPKTVFDQAIPSGTSVALSVLAVLGDLLDDGSRYAKEALRQLSLLGPLAEKAPLGLGELLCASLLALQGPVTVQGAKASGLCRHPHVFRKPGDSQSEWLICHRGTCSLPQTSADGALALIQAAIHSRE